MELLIETPRAASTAALRREIDSFLRFIQCRGDHCPPGHRRVEARCGRSWPLEVERPDQADSVVCGVVLYNASESGVAFLTSEPIPSGSPIAVRLFWKQDERPRIPAVVRHATLTEHGFLIGAEFLLDDEGP